MFFILFSLFLLSAGGSVFLGDFITNRMARGDEEWANNKQAFSTYAPYPSLGIDHPETFLAQSGFETLSLQIVGLSPIDYGRSPQVFVIDCLFNCIFRL